MSNNRKTNIAALLILAVMALLLFASVKNDSAIMDELAHIPAGYSYLFLRDYRLNPEHPPLAKLLAAIPLVFIQPHFPTDTKSWQEDINGQWDQGRIFLYESGNDADNILFWMRTPLILLALGFGWLLFWWTKKKFGVRAALLALAFYAFSPTFLAHSRFVTTDLVAAFAFFIGIISFSHFLEKPTWKNVIIAGVAFGTAQLLKFSLFLLIPLFGILLILWIATHPHLRAKGRFLLFLTLLGKTILIGVVGLILIWGVYGYAVWSYPAERQLQDTQFLLGSFGIKPLAAFDLWMISQPLLRPLAHYLLGVLMVVQRVAGGNTAYFLGEVSAAGSTLYFPTVYLLKETLALHILSLVALCFALKKTFRAETKSLDATRVWIRNHFFEASALIFIAFYWAWTIRSPLNIGVRHLLPTFPFIYMLIAKEITQWLHWNQFAAPRTWWEVLQNIFRLFIKGIPKYLFLGAMLIWMIASAIVAFPHFLSYYNELAGGTDNGWHYAVDSNYDWGQDLRRLKQFADENNVDKISLDYFGGGNPRYYLGDRFESWWSARGPASGWFAISVSFLQSAHGAPAPGFVRKPEDSYEWLKPYQPVARAGKSIFIYKLP